MPISSTRWLDRIVRIIGRRWLEQKEREIRLRVLHLDMSPGRKGGSTFQHKPRHQFDMRGVAELIDRRHAFDPVAAIDQDPGVAREGGDVA
jgi:hypothetical protein